MTITKDKVFCEDCKYLKIYTFSMIPAQQCDHPDNLEEMRGSDTWLRPGILYTRRIRLPKDINRENDCIWHCKKPPPYKKERK